MNYYKIIADRQFIGIANSFDLRRYQHKNKILLVCDESKAQYIQCNDNFYHAKWMLPINTNKIDYEIVDVIQIDETEYKAILDIIKAGKEVEILPEDEEIEELPIEENDITVDYVRATKIKELSNKCKQIIINGFDLVLSDGATYHFSLTTQDQLNLITLAAMLDSGESEIPYHADGELCRFYTNADIENIIESATRFKTFHVSYFNSLKNYVNSLDIDDVKNIDYGVEIPGDYQSEVLQSILKETTR